LNIEPFGQKVSTKSKSKLLGKLRQAILIIEKPWMSGFLEADFVIFRPKLKEILNFE
jgi:hypothetical protein